MTFTLLDTHAQTIVPITPVDGDTLRIYFCGPTVYDRLHIGNLRSMMAADILVRTARRHYPTLFVRNITDIDDKIMNRAAERNISIQTLTDATIAQYHADLEHLRIAMPDIEPRATDYVAEMITMIEQILAHGHAYTTNGHVFFDSTTPTDHIPFARPHDADGNHQRVEHDYGQRRDSDFVLWKPSTDNEPGWDSPWGRGRPGWHIECSAMTHKTLGDTFDIHGGGKDLAFPHHSNEARQCHAAHPHAHHAKHWMHSGMLNVDGRKMAKSIGNTMNLDYLIERYDTDTIRIAFMMTHWHKTLDFTAQRLHEAEQLRLRLRAAIDPIWTPYSPTDPRALAHAPGLVAMDNNLNTVDTLQSWLTLSPSEVLEAAQYMGLFHDAPYVGRTSLDADDINQYIAERHAARAAKQWAKADEIRATLLHHGVQLTDQPDGSTTYTII